MFKSTYADQLYRWSLLDVRATLLKTVHSDSSVPTIALQCGTCQSTYTGARCSCMSLHRRAQEFSLPQQFPIPQQFALQCALCRSGVRGSGIICFQCGHGGHLQHMRMWFKTDTECASGCGCYCLEYSAVEY